MNKMSSQNSSKRVDNLYATNDVQGKKGIFHEILVYDPSLKKNVNILELIKNNHNTTTKQKKGKEVTINKLIDLKDVDVSKLEDDTVLVWKKSEKKFIPQKIFEESN